jgi:hypothetical protein
VFATKELVGFADLVWEMQFENGQGGGLFFLYGMNHHAVHWERWFIGHYNISHNRCHNLLVDKLSTDVLLGIDVIGHGVWIPYWHGDPNDMHGLLCGFHFPSGIHNKC